MRRWWFLLLLWACYPCDDFRGVRQVGMPAPTGTEAVLGAAPCDLDGLTIQWVDGLFSCAGTDRACECQVPEACGGWVAVTWRETATSSALAWGLCNWCLRPDYDSPGVASCAERVNAEAASGTGAP
jgi:hypothetical protein